MLMTPNLQSSTDIYKIQILQPQQVQPMSNDEGYLKLITEDLEKAIAIGFIK